MRSFLGRHDRANTRTACDCLSGCVDFIVAYEALVAGDANEWEFEKKVEKTVRMRVTGGVNFGWIIR